MGPSHQSHQFDMPMCLPSPRCLLFCPTVKPSPCPHPPQNLGSGGSQEILLDRPPPGAFALQQAAAHRPSSLSSSGGGSSGEDLPEEGGDQLAGLPRGGTAITTKNAAAAMLAGSNGKLRSSLRNHVGFADTVAVVAGGAAAADDSNDGEGASRSRRQLAPVRTSNSMVRFLGIQASPLASSDDDAVHRAVLGAGGGFGAPVLAQAAAVAATSQRAPKKQPPPAPPPPQSDWLPLQRSGGSPAAPVGGALAPEPPRAEWLPLQAVVAPPPLQQQQRARPDDWLPLMQQPGSAELRGSGGDWLPLSGSVGAGRLAFSDPFGPPPSQMYGGGGGSGAAAVLLQRPASAASFVPQAGSAFARGVPPGGSRQPGPYVSLLQQQGGGSGSPRGVMHVGGGGLLHSASFPLQPQQQQPDGVGVTSLRRPMVAWEGDSGDDIAPLPGGFSPLRPSSSASGAPLAPRTAPSSYYPYHQRVPPSGYGPPAVGSSAMGGGIGAAAGIRPSALPPSLSSLAAAGGAGYLGVPLGGRSQGAAAPGGRMGSNSSSGSRSWDQQR